MGEKVKILFDDGTIHEGEVIETLDTDDVNEAVEE